MTKADKRIPVTEERWNELHEMKGAGETYDELIEKLIKERKKARLFEDMEQIRNESEFEPI